MFERVATAGAGYTPFRSIAPEVSHREIIFEAAAKAHNDAGVSPNDISTFVSITEDHLEGTAITEDHLEGTAITEDHLEGTAIAEEYVPGQLGAVLKPVRTVTAEGITGIASLVMQLQTEQHDPAVIEGHSKASNVDSPAHIEAFALDPLYARPLGLHLHCVAGMEMRAFLDETGNTERLAAYPANLTADDIMDSRPEAEPIKRGDIASLADGAIVFMLARESRLSRIGGEPVFINGIGGSQDTPNIEERELHRAIYLQRAAERACRKAGIGSPMTEIYIAEVDNTFTYKELQHLEA